MTTFTRRQVLGAGLAAAGAAVVGSIGLPYIMHTRPKKNVVFIVGDAMRSDALGRVYSRADYISEEGERISFRKRTLTPNLDELCSKGTKFDFAVSPSTWTPISMVAITYWANPAGINYGALENVKGKSIPEKFKEAGYVTLGSIANEVIEIPEISRGFDEVRFLHLTEDSKQLSSWARVPTCAERWAVRTNRAAIELLDYNAPQNSDQCIS